MYLSLRCQLELIFSQYGDNILYSNNRHKINEYNLEDIYDGQGYENIDSESTISINFNYDGVPVFKSSTFSAHPILCTINDFAPKLRRSLVLLTGLWFGRKKPNVNTYFKPFVRECTQLYEYGFHYSFNGTNYHKKCKILVGVCDSVARCDVRKFKQFNGEYGCGLCKHIGIQVEKGNGTVRVYPVDSDNNPFGEGLRSHDKTINVHYVGEKGIKGRSIVSKIPGFDIIENLPPDWMHCVGLGVCRQFANMWFDIYFQSTLLSVDRLLLEIKPTSDICRTPRIMTDRKHWKAHERIVWLLYYSIPVLKQVLSYKYVDHWSLLVEAIYILINTSITKSDIHYAESCLIHFVRDISELYDISHVSFNVHLLTHLPNSARQWGPLWSHSAFAYENHNQKNYKNYKKLAACISSNLSIFSFKKCCSLLIFLFKRKTF